MKWLHFETPCCPFPSLSVQVLASENEGSMTKVQPCCSSISQSISVPKIVNYGWECVCGKLYVCVANLKQVIEIGRARKGFLVVI